MNTLPFKLDDCMRVLEQTPAVLDALLRNKTEAWTHTSEGGETWSAYDVMGHLIHGENTDWMERLEITLSDKAERKFKPFDRFAQFEESKGKSLHQLLDEFALLRKQNLDRLKGKNLQEEDLKRTAIHPVFGEVTLQNLLATWTVHDLNHLSQISRVMAKLYSIEVGPWIEYLRILK